MTWLIGQAFPVERASDDAERLDAAAIDTTIARARNPATLTYLRDGLRGDTWGEMRLASFTVSGALALVVATVAMGQAFAPPTWPQLFVGLDGRPPGAVPGLARPIGPDSSRTATAVPTARQCAAQWNMHAPSATKRWLGSHGATRADVTVMKVGAQKIGTSERYVFSQCAFGVRVGPKTLVAAVAPLPNSSAASRGELLGYRTSAALAHLARRFNATVTSDGRLRL